MPNRLVLKPMPQSVEGLCIGTFDGIPLHVNGMEATVDGRTFPVGLFGEDLLDAVDAAATPLFGGDWGTRLSLVTGLNRRTCSRSRIARNGLPADVLHFLAQASAGPCPAAIGDLMLAAAKIMRDTRPDDAVAHLDLLMGTVESSIGFVRGLTDARRAHREVVRAAETEALAA